MSCVESIIQLWAYAVMAVVGLVAVLVTYLIVRAERYDRRRPR